MDIITVFLNDSDDQNIQLQITENSTAQEILRQIASNSSLIRESELNEYALFIKLDFYDSQNLKERMLSSQECPLKIKKKVIETKYKFIAKKCSVILAPIEDNVLGERNLTEDMIREGSLKKSSKNNWVDRYFILDAKCIYYGKDKKTIAKAFTRIDLETVSVQDASDKGKYCFQLIVAQHNKYILKGNNTQNKEKWMQSISNQCSIVRENREFENINRKIRNEENKRAASDEKLVLECHNFDKLIQINEGLKLLIELEPEDMVRTCLFNILDYKNFRNKPSLALNRAESILNSVDLIKSRDFLELVFGQGLLDKKQKRLSEFKRKKSMDDKSDQNIDLYSEFFAEFIKNYVEYKKKLVKESPEYYSAVLEKLYELPLNRWKSSLRSAPEPI